MIKVILDTSISGGHKDLTLNIEDIGFIQIADTYYFNINLPYTQNTRSLEKLITYLNQFIENWISCVEDLKKGKCTYLPFDLSDEYVGFLKIDQNSEFDVLITYGYSTSCAGYNINPLECKNKFINDNEFENITESFRKNKELFIKELKTSFIINK